MTRREGIPRLAALMVWMACSTLVTGCDTKPGHLAHTPVTGFPNALIDGGFEDGRDRDGRPDGWTLRGQAERVTDGRAAGGAALSLTGTETHASPQAVQRVPIPHPHPLALTLASLVRGTAIEPRGDGKGVAEMRLAFFAQDGRVIRRSTIRTRQGTFGWQPWAGSKRIPKDATTLEVVLALSEATGQVTFDEVQLFWNLPDDYDRQNLVIDGGFEYLNPLSVWELDKGQKVIYPGAKGRAALQVKLKQPGRAGANQRLVLDDSAIRDARLEFDLKLKKVKASAPQGGAKVELRFWDAQDRPLEPPVVVGPWTGTQKTWKRRAKRVRIPPEAQEATLSLMLDGARGTVWFDGVRLTAHAGEGPIVRRLESRTETANWTVFRPVEGPLAAPFDASVLLDPPAGRHGFLTVQDGHFVFEDGTPARFFGLNIDGASAFPTHEHAERFAERLAQLGCNLVRLHHLDAPWVKPNIFDPTVKDTQHLSRESLDRLDYFIAQLKARGIYVYMDLLVSRKFKSQDGVPAYRRLPRGAKIVAQYSPRLIQLQKQYARDLLTHYNPYTKARLVDEPALVFVDLINESSLAARSRRFRKLPRAYLDELEMLWLEYLGGQGLSRSTVDALVDRKPYLEVGDPFVQRFFASLQLRYFDELSAYLRGLGLKIPIAGSNRSSLSLKGWDLLTNASLDFIDRHAYWDHPRGGYGNLVRFHNRSMIEAAQEHNPVAKLSSQRVAEMPFVVSEWNVPWPNEYRAAGPLLMAAYASFQDWDGLIQFAYNGALAPTQIDGNFDVSTMPEQFLQLPAAARLFHRREVQAARVRRAYPIHAEHRSIKPTLALRHGVARGVGDEAPREEVATASNPWISDTGELTWDERGGRVFIDAPRLQAVIGRVAGGPHELRDATFAMTTPFASLVLTSLDDRPLRTSRYLLLTTVARSENTGTVYNATRTLLRDSGTSPILMEPVIGSASVPLGERRLVAVFALDAAGHRQSEVAVRTSRGSLQIPLGEAHAYEILFEESS